MFNLSKTPESIKAESAKSQSIKIMAMEDGDTPELLIMDRIGKDYWGDGVAAEDVATFLTKHKNTEVKARINSFGGDAYVGLVIHNAFANHGNVTAVVEGIAFSAAAVAAAGAKKLSMFAESDFGIHRAWILAAGNVNELKATIEWLEAIDDHQINIYERRTGADREQIIKWLEGTADGTVFSAQAAFDAGFADEIITPGQQREESNSSAEKRIAAERRHQLAMSAFRRSLTKSA